MAGSLLSQPHVPGKMASFCSQTMNQLRANLQAVGVSTSRDKKSVLLAKHTVWELGFWDEPNAPKLIDDATELWGTTVAVCDQMLEELDVRPLGLKANTIAQVIQARKAVRKQVELE